ncbi:Efflux pump periplasmic linker BepF [Planctomycetes bacterium Poly30]|uniref:Efflux pump periplasmic linker BepF n=1 Tax=Saltatorellus ferox TaxID=2528018 RepID=A0A518EX91_9BACT|nr:Efflux pump periplasmic linker BepF [Planctomycetes bacterium Poly30]
MRFPSASVVLLASLCLASTACKQDHGEEHEGEHEVAHTVVVTTPVAKSVVATKKYVSQIHSQRHIELRALERGYLEEVLVDEGQSVKKGQLMFKLLPVVFKAKLHGDEAELQRVEITLKNTEKLFEQKVVSDQELALVRTELEKAKAQVELATAELSFTEIRAPFDGIIDRQYEQQGSLTEEGDMLTTVSDNSVMWVYFNVPEADYLDFRVIPGAVDPDHQQRLTLPNTQIELQLASGRLFDQTADQTVTVESTFDNETGNIQFRADFPNPDGLLRHGQTGTLLIHRTLEDAVVIPQRSTFEILDKQYVYVIDEDGHAHQRRITTSHEMDDVFVIDSGLEGHEKIVLDGVRQVHDGEHVEFEFRDPEVVLGQLKHRAE